MRRLPIYFLIDTSGSMRGSPIDSVNVCVQGMIENMCSDPDMLERAHICIMTFNLGVEVVVPLTALSDLKMPHITVLRSNPSHLGSALGAVCDAVGADVRKSTREIRGDWWPVLVVFSDGRASDIEVFREETLRIRSVGFKSIVGCIAGTRERTEAMQSLCDDVFLLDMLNSLPFSLGTYLGRRDELERSSLD